MNEPIRKNFASDNVVSVCPEIMAAILAANEGSVPSYGDDFWSNQLNARFSDLFEHPVQVFPVTTGTACNALALSAIVPPFGSVLCDQNAHITTEEAGAPEFFTHGAKLISLPSADGRITEHHLGTAIDKVPHGVSTSPLSALSLTQATEWGTVYETAHIGALCERAHLAGMNVHMDGARFANAVAGLGCSAADVTWKAGIDVLSMGATKNGALAAEAVIFFNAELAQSFERRVKRGGHLWSKQRFVSAQLLAYIRDDLWLNNARQANAMASRLAAGLRSHNVTQILHDVQGNEVFVSIPDTYIEKLRSEGFVFYEWEKPEDIKNNVIRLVTSYQTTNQDVDAFLSALK